MFPPETINTFLNICRKYGIGFYDLFDPNSFCLETDVETVERLVKGEKANMAIYEGGTKPRIEREPR